MPNTPTDSKSLSSTAVPSESLLGVSNEVLNKGVDFIEKGKNIAIDTFIDVGTKYVVKLIPGGDLAQLAWGAVAKEAGQNLKVALHEATQLQRSPIVLDRTIHYPGDAKDSKGPRDLFDPEARKKFDVELKKPTTPDDLKGVTITLPKSGSTSPQPIEKNLTRIGVSKADQKKIIKEALQKTNLSLKQLEEKIDKVVNWQAAQAEKEKREQAFQELGQAVEFFGQLGALTGCREIQQFAVFANAGINIGKSIATLTDGFAFGPVVGIASAALSIFSLFMKTGPDPTQLILEQIGKLSEQITILQKETRNNSLINAKMQVTILNAVCDGFNKLSLQVDRQITGLRTELYTILQDIQGRLNFLIRYTQHADIVQNLVDLETACSHVNLYIKEIYSGNVNENAMKYGVNLLIWAKDNSTKDILTGCDFFKTELFIDHLEENLEAMDKDAQRVNFFLGFFAVYAQKHFKASYAEREIKDNKDKNKSKTIAQVDPTTIPNPMVWFRAVQHYIELYSIFPQLDNDDNNSDKAIEEMIGVGQRGLDFVDHLTHDQAFWEALLADYYTWLGNVRKSADKYAKDYSEARLKELNTAYRQSAISEQPEIKTLNFLDAPAILIAQFANRSISHLPGDIVPQGRLAEVINSENEKLRNKLPVFNGFKSKLPNEILCAEFLKRITFSAKTREINDSKDYKTVFNRKAEPYHKARLTHQKHPVTHMIVPVWDYPEGMGGRGTVYKKPLDSANINGNEWQLPLELTYQVEGENSDNFLLATMSYKGEWKEFLGYDIATWSSDTPAIEKQKDLYTTPEGVTYIPCAYSSHEVVMQFEKQMAEWIRDYWNDPKGKPFATSITNKSDVPDKVKQEINRYYQDCRTAIVKTLLENKEAVPEYKQALTKLNISVGFIRRYASLIGKKEDDPLLLSLVTGKTIENELALYKDDKTLPNDWLACITQALDDKNKITYQMVRAIPPSESLPLAVSLLTSGQLRLRAYQAWRAAYKLKFPTFSQYIDAQEYERHCEKTRTHLFQNRVYKEFENLHAAPFNTAKFTLDGIRRKIQPLGADGGAELYNDSLKAIQEWTISKSRSELVTQFAPVITANVEEAEIVQLKELYLKPYGWSSNIRFFMQVARQLSGTDFSKFSVDRQSYIIFPDLYSDSDFINPANFVMWSEGVFTYLKLILSNPAIDPLAEKARDSTEIRLNNLDVFSAIGENLRGIIATIALSYPLFNELFSRLINRFDEPLAFIEMKLGKDHQVFVELSKENPKNIDVFRLLATKPYQGARDKLFDEFSTLAARILAFVEMSFGYDVQRVPNSNYEIYIGKERFILYTDKEKLLEYLQENNDKDKIYVAINAYINQIRRLRQLVLLRIVYANDIALFRQYLQTYLQINWPTNTLCITEGQLPIISLTKEKIELIDLFLSKRQDIDVIEITGVELNDETLTRIMHVLIKYPRIKSLRLVNCSLQASSLEILKNYLVYLPKLSSLDLSNNDFAKNNKTKGIFKLVELLEVLPFLHELHLVDNNLGDDGLCAVVAVLEGRPLSALNFSGNVCSTANTLQHILAALFAQHPKLQSLFLSRMELQVVDLQTVAPAVKHLTELKVLDLSGNHFDDSVKQVMQLAKFLECLQPQIQLNLANTRLGDNGACAVVATFGHAQVNLTGNPVSEEVRAMIASTSTKPIALVTPATDMVTADASRDTKPDEKVDVQMLDIQSRFVPLSLNLRLGQPALDNLMQMLNMARGVLNQHLKLEQRTNLDANRSATNAIKLIKLPLGSFIMFRASDKRASIHQSVTQPSNNNSVNPARPSFMK